MSTSMSREKITPIMVTTSMTTDIVMANTTMNTPITIITSIAGRPT